MKTNLAHRLQLAVLLALSIAAFAPKVIAQLAIPNADGSDGAFIVSSNITIDLSQAGTGSWTNTAQDLALARTIQLHGELCSSIRQRTARWWC